MDIIISDNSINVWRSDYTKNTLQGFGWQREEIGKPNVIRAKYYPDRTEYTYSDKRKKDHTEYKP
jgi:hypothetical protein